MYIEYLQTPHPVVAEKEFVSQQPLLDVVDFDQAQTYIENAGHPGLATVEVVDFFKEQVHRTLRHANEDTYDQTVKMNTDEALRTLQLGTCIGHLTVFSELLEQARIEHYFSYCGGHWFATVPYEDMEGESQLYLADAFSPKVSQSMTSSITRTTTAAIQKTLACSQRAVVEVDWNVVELNVEKTSGKDPSLSLPDRSLVEAGGHRAFMSLYPQEIGATIVRSYVDFRSAVWLGDPDRALQSLEKLAGKYPEIDARASHDLIKKLVSQLVDQDRSIDALTAIEQYCSSFAPSTDPRLLGLRANLFLSVAKQGNDRAVAGVAVKAYLEAIQNERSDLTPSETFQGRLRIATQLANVEPCAA